MVVNAMRPPPPEDLFPSIAPLPVRAWSDGAELHAHVSKLLARAEA